MNLRLLIALATLSLVCAWPASREQQEQQEQQQASLTQQEPLQPAWSASSDASQQDTVKQELPEMDALATLTDVQDMGSQHAEQGSRNARWLWGGGYWGRPWHYHRYYYSPYYSWGHRYHNYWW